MAELSEASISARESLEELQGIAINTLAELGVARGLIAHGEQLLGQAPLKLDAAIDTASGEVFRAIEAGDLSGRLALEAVLDVRAYPYKNKDDVKLPTELILDNFDKLSQPNVPYSKPSPEGFVNPFYGVTAGFKPIIWPEYHPRYKNLLSATVRFEAYGINLTSIGPEVRRRHEPRHISVENMHRMVIGTDQLAQRRLEILERVHFIKHRMGAPEHWERLETIEQVLRLAHTLA